jgi:CheY-like chemotaxis protein
MHLHAALCRLLRASAVKRVVAAPIAPTPSVTLDQSVILVVEDNPTNQLLARKLLERWGYQTVVVSNGREAVDAVRRSRYAAILMDCQMPVMDGFDATGEIRRLEGTSRRTPIIAMTAHAMTGDRERSLQAGMDDYISKPVDSDLLKRMLLRWMPQPSRLAR